MKRLFIHSKLLEIFSIFLLCSCSNETQTTNNTEEITDTLSELNLPDQVFNYEAANNLPTYYTTNLFPTQAQFQRSATELDNTPNNNSITNNGATLGRVLFYDKKLSANQTIACASCHKQSEGFSDSNVLSIGFEGGLTRRHSMGLANARFYYSGKFFWDERANSLEEQVLMPFLDPVEMGLSLDDLIEIINAQDYYAVLFENAFGDNTVTSERIGNALAQFIRSMVSITSKYDYARNEVSNPLQDFPSFTSEENAGKRLFFNPIETTSGTLVSCASCHISEAFVGSIPPISVTTTSTNNGLDAQSTNDLGIFETTNNQNDIGKFKTPSLKNISVTAPYMHDGRFSTLEEVIEHYNNGIQNHINLSPQLKNENNSAIQLNLTQQEKDNLLAFLNTLTDEELNSDEKFSNPFN